MNVIEQMRADWNRRAREDANYYVAFATMNDEEFLATGARAVGGFEAEFHRLPPAAVGDRRALEIGCGPGRLMIPMSRHFGEIHGVDISDEMVALAKQKLAGTPNAHAHVNSGCDLSLFDDGYFDFVYSWIVLQHIPSKEVVLSYLREAQRVLKPGGILACQLRGVKPIDSELKPGWETWTGCWFSGEEIFEFSSAQEFPLVSISGIDTQYTFTVFRKALGQAAIRPEQVALLAVTAGTNGWRLIPTRGHAAAVSLWLDGFPEDGGLVDFPVVLGNKLQTGCFVAPVSASGGCQFNAMLPKGMEPGPLSVRLSYRGSPITEAHEVEVVTAPPRNPKILLVTDRVNLLAQNRSENDGFQVSIFDVEDPAAVSIAVGGERAESTVVVCEDPIGSTYAFGFPVPPGIRKGANALTVRVGDRQLEAVAVEIV